MTPFFNKLQRDLKVCFAALCMLLVASPATVHAYDFTINGISYDVLSYDELRCEVADVFTKADGAIKIPDTVEFDGRIFRVTSIGNQAFKGCSSITSIQLPADLTAIGNEAFCNCRSLLSLHLPDGVTTIGNSAFMGCSSVSSIQLPNSVTFIGNSAFEGCSSLRSLQVPDGVTSIGAYTFVCENLSELYLPKSLRKLENRIFCREYYSDVLGCPFLSSLICRSAVPADTEGNSFYGYDKNVSYYQTNTTLYVPKGSLEAYKEAKGWKDFKIVEYDLEDGIDEVVAPGAVRKEVGRYDLSGREVDGGHKGITIVRYDDGSATKIYQD